MNHCLEEEQTPRLLLPDISVVVTKFNGSECVFDLKLRVFLTVVSSFYDTRTGVGSHLGMCLLPIRNFSSTKYRSHRRISEGLQVHLLSILPLYRAELGSGRFPSTAAHY